MTNTVGSLIRAAREAQGITQSELAEDVRDLGLDIDPTAITRIERDQRDLRLSQLATIATALGTSVHALIPTQAGSTDTFARGYAAGRYAGLREARAAIDNLREQP